MIKNTEKLILLIIPMLLSSITPFVYAQSSLSLHDVLDAALEIQSSNTVTSFSIKDDGSVTWIDGNPSISLMRLESQQELGTTESEFSLNLPIKSSYLRRIEKNLAGNISNLQQIAQQQYTLYLSGLIREILWEIELQKASGKLLDQKYQLLSALASKYKNMAESQAIPLYLSLIIQNEINELALSSMENKQNLKSLRAQYFRLTGLHMSPEDITEQMIAVDQLDINLHVNLKALDAVFENTQQNLYSSGKESQPWNVQVTSRRVSTPDFSETQLGIGMEVPLIMGNNLSMAQQNEHLKITTEHAISRTKLLTQLNETQQKLLHGYKFLLQKQNLLDNGLPTLNALSEAMQDLREVNGPNQEFYIRTLLSSIDSAKHVELNQLHIQRHIALIRQAAGIPL